jgi:hypothetical protein
LQLASALFQNQGNTAAAEQVRELARGVQPQ